MDQSHSVGGAIRPIAALHENQTLRQIFRPQRITSSPQARRFLRLSRTLGSNAIVLHNTRVAKNDFGEGAVRKLGLGFLVTGVFGQLSALIWAYTVGAD